MAVHKNYIYLGFSLKGLSKNEQELFYDTSKTMKQIMFYSLDDIDEKKLLN